MKSPAQIRSEWIGHLLSTAAANRPRAEAGVRDLYVAAGFPPPQHFLWFDSPCAASWVVALIAARYHYLWAQRFAGPGLTKTEREQLDRARSTLGDRLGVRDDAALLDAIGAPRGMSLQAPPNPARLFTMPFTTARFTLSDDVASWHTAYTDDDDLYRAESRFAGSNHGVLRSAFYCPSTDLLISASFFSDYPPTRMADDERLAGDRDLPPIMQAASQIGRSAGLWWPFENAAILCERPTELHVNERHVPHRADGPAIAFRDGSRVYAWNGKAVPEQWIMDPASVAPREFKGFDRTFLAHVVSKSVPSPKAKKTTKKARPSALLSTALPQDSAARLELLRSRAGGALPRYDRYVGGAHREVWQELVALGDAVREEPTVADALAVAYETMGRVASNVRTLIDRLTAMGYVFGPIETQGDVQLAIGGPQGATRMDLSQLIQQLSGSQRVADSPHLSGLFNMMSKARDLLASQTAKAKQERPPHRPHIPPTPDVHKEIADFEKEFGAVPLSVRAFNAVVGHVDLIGSHPSIAPKDGRIAPDPLVVEPLHEGAVELDEDEDDASAIMIAPDALHKANTSGGAPYEIAIPDLRADGEFLNERHHLFFVDYLRLCFKFGGFPGYDGADKVPPEITELGEGLIEF